jgi:serine phosphatase RsbU (regulator of sigma subunit)
MAQRVEAESVSVLAAGPRGDAAEAPVRLPGGRSAPSRAALFAMVAVAYYLGGRLGLNLSLVSHNVTPLWPPTGIAVAALLVLGRSVWPAIFVAALAVNLPISATLLAAGVTAMGNTLAPVVAVTLLQRAGFRRQLDRHHDAIAIVFIGALGSMLVSATIGAVTLAASGTIAASQLPTAWAVWWTGDAMGVLAVTPFLLCLPLFWEHDRWPPRMWFEGAVVLVTTTGVVMWACVTGLPVLFLALPVLGIASWRLQLRGAAPAALLAALVATWSAAHELGPFAGRTVLEQMVTLQCFNASVALTSFFLASLVSERLQATSALAAAADDLERRVRQRTAELSTANALLYEEIEVRSHAQEQLTHEAARTRREHDIAETLQRSLLPDRLPDVPGVDLAARYVPATADLRVGGDWYDVIDLPDGLVGLAIGDVAGHGLQAAATMVQVRMALRACALQDPSPAVVLHGIHRLVEQLRVPEMVTLTYLVFDPATGRLRWTSAGHPPALVCVHGAGAFLSGGLAPPLGATGDGRFTEADEVLGSEATLLLYTDGLVERRGEPISVGLDRLRRETEAFDAETGPSERPDLEALCDRLVGSLLDQVHVEDDVALVALRRTSQPHA